VPLSFFFSHGLTSFSWGIAQTSSSPVTARDAAYVHSFEIWKAERIDDLKQDWLPLAGFYWLWAGVNSFGSAGGNAIVFPAGPAHAGGFSLESKDVTFKLFPEAHGLIAGKPITAAPERPDPDISGHPSTGEMGSLRFHRDRARRSGRQSSERLVRRDGPPFPRPNVVSAGHNFSRHCDRGAVG